MRVTWLVSFSSLSGYAAGAAGPATKKTIGGRADTTGTPTDSLKPAGMNPAGGRLCRVVVVFVPVFHRTLAKNDVAGAAFLQGTGEVASRPARGTARCGPPYPAPARSKK